MVKLYFEGLAMLASLQIAKVFMLQVSSSASFLPETMSSLRVGKGCDDDELMLLLTHIKCT